MKVANVKKRGTHLYGCLCILALLLSFSRSADAGATFSFRKAITINQAGGRGNLANFPFLVSMTDNALRSTANGGNVAHANGYDIMFTDGTINLDFEIEHFDGTSGTLLAWVRIPLLQPGVNTIYLNYGDPQVTLPTETRGAVFDSDHVGVWHLGEVGTGAPHEFRDSSPYRNHGRGGEGDPLFVPSRVTGPLGFGYGQHFDNADTKYDLIDFGDDASFDITGNQITLEAWIKHNITTPFSPNRGVLNHTGATEGYRLIFMNQAAVPPGIDFQLPGTTHSLRTASGISAGVWHHIVATYDGAAMRVFVDGVNSGPLAKTTNILPALGQQDFWVGHGDQPKGMPWSFEWDGDIDEVRISNVARSAAWVATEYDNQTSTCFPTTAFCSVGAQTPGPFAVSTLAVHHRSIGTATGNLATGSATSFAGSTIVTFGSSLPTNIGLGDKLSLDPGGLQEDLFIVSRDSDTQVTVELPPGFNRTVPFTIKRAYPSLQAWETGVGGNLVTGNRREIGVAYNDGDLTSPVVIEGSITDPVRNMKLTVAAGRQHYGLAATGVVLDNSGSSNPAIQIKDEFVTVEWFEIKGGTGTSADGIEIANSIAPSNRTVLRNNLIHDTGGDGIRLSDPDSVADIFNNIIYNASYGVHLTVDMAPDARLNIFNNTIYQCAASGIHTDVRQTSVRVDPRNNISHSNTNADFAVVRPFDRAYFCNPVCTQIANGGLVPGPNEYLADTNNNFTLSFATGSDFLYLGSPWPFRGAGVVLATNGSGGADLKWEYWNGTVWADLEAGSFHDGTQNFSLGGTVYWADDPGGWSTTSVNGSPNLYFVRARWVSGSYATPPLESLITRADVNIAGRNNLSSDVTASPHSRFELGTSGLDNVDAIGVNFMSTGAGSENLHIASGSLAEDTAFGLSSFFTGDIDGGLRTGAWDIGADEVSATTAVELVSFEARAGDGAVALTWETGSEVDNVGFYLYRAESEAGPYELVNESMIPGLGSSPRGALYRYVDAGRVNGTTYFYELEDLESTGVRERHGPVSATPQAGASFELPESSSEESSPFDPRITYGDPEATSLQVLQQNQREVVLELLTAGFYATPQPDGSVHLEVPGFLGEWEPGAPAIPVKQAWVQALAGKGVHITSVRATEVESFSLRPSSADLLEPVMTPRGELLLARRAQNPGRAFRGQGLYPDEAARLVSVAFQEELKKALVELAPLRWDRSTGKLLLARRLVVRLKFTGRADGEVSRGGSRGRKHRGHAEEGKVVAHLVTHERGLYGVPFEAVFGERGDSVKTSKLRLNYQGEPVAYHVEPNANRFGRRSVLYFLSEGEDLNPYGREAVYELALGGETEQMALLAAPPSGQDVSFYWQTLELEENHLFQGRLTTAPDVWLWDQLLAPGVSSYPFQVNQLAAVPEASRLKLWIQGTTDLPVDPDHHLRLFVNGTLIDDFTLEGELAWQGDYELLAGLLQEGDNLLQIENVGDTGAAFSRVMTDRFEIRYPRQLVADSGRLEGSFSASGLAEVLGVDGAAFLLDTTDTSPLWLRRAEVLNDVVRFSVEQGRRYLLADASGVLAPEVRQPLPRRLTTLRGGAHYLVIGPQSLLEASWPLLELRASQGLSSFAVSMEQIYSEFGHGETRPEALRGFLEHAYHHWQTPPRYVLLLGDATFDFKDYIGWGVVNQVPPFPLKTSYIWTASDPAFAAVNGDDILPDVALGRLPAANLQEARAMVDKILAYESQGLGLDGRAVLVADRPDPAAGDFVAHAEELASTLLAGHDLEKIYLSQLGAAATQQAIRDAFDQGASLMSYIGHGGMQIWNQNILRGEHVSSFSSQSQQPLLLTMNCLNGYFQFPLFDSLSETLLKAEGKGVIAAFSPSGLSLDGPAHLYHRLLLAELLHGNHQTLGDAILAAQTKYVDAGGYLELLRIYHLLGDPALTLRH